MENSERTKQPKKVNGIKNQPSNASVAPNPKHKIIVKYKIKLKNSIVKILEANEPFNFLISPMTSIEIVKEIIPIAISKYNSNIFDNMKKVATNKKAYKTKKNFVFLPSMEIYYFFMTK